MGFLRKLLGFGTTVAGTVAAVKVTEKVKENNPEGVQDVNGDGKVDYKDYAIEAKKAAQEVYAEAKEKAPGVMAEAKARSSEIYADAKDKVKETFGGTPKQ